MILEKMILYESELTQKMDALSKDLDSAPPGELFIAHNGKYAKWFHRTEQSLTYLPKKKISLAQKLAVKKLKQAQYLDYQHELSSVRKYLKSYKNHTSKTEKLFNDSAFLYLLKEGLQPLSSELSVWKNADYVKKISHPESLLVQTITGNKVRSKSESFIEQVLFINQIPYRYECALTINGTTLYPDFTIRHPATGETFYWEHFGLMDNSRYAQTACQKLQLYTTNGIIPTINLITTFETQNHPFDIQQAEDIIRKYFLA